MMADGFYTMNKLRNGSHWRAKETVGGAFLEPLQPPDNSLAKVRFSHQVFKVLGTKKRQGETVREALERIILSSP
jgi:hypothetical protein